MSEITKKDVEYTAKLARLKINEEDKERFALDLKEVVSYIGKLSELDEELEQKNISPTLHAFEGKGTLLREDEVKESINRSEALKEAANGNEEFFFVSKVIE
jgi:aspartyl-tRNA(Asn)/glutamyl-tRNA(Gln) amidotransferase subunit C